VLSGGHLLHFAVAGSETQLNELVRDVEGVASIPLSLRHGVSVESGDVSVSGTDSD
jgi:hypothetical protein